MPTVVKLEIHITATTATVYTRNTV